MQSNSDNPISALPLAESTFILTQTQIAQIVQEALLRAQGSQIGRDLDRYVLREDYEALNRELQSLLSDIAKFKIFSDGLRIGELRDEVDFLTAQLSKMRGIKPSGKKSEERIEKLAMTLMYRKNTPLTYAEIGKILELGSRTSDGKKNTREQNMTHLGKKLETMPDKFIVMAGKTRGGKLVKLTAKYFDHLCKECMPS